MSTTELTILVRPMKLSALIEGLETKKVSGNVTEDILGIAHHSSHVRSGFLFVAQRGGKHNGHDFISEAIRQGAKAIVAEALPETNLSVTWIEVPDSRKALARVSANFWGDPSLKMKVVGITGTNGKTTTSYLLESIVHYAGYTPGVIGTINYRFGSQVIKSSHTTPESLEIQKLLAHMLKEKVTHAIIEVSSHALVQDRVEGVHFDVGVFTNLTSEHLDYHGTIEHYAQSKAKLFSYFLEKSFALGLKFAVLNQDDLQADYFCSLTSAQVIRYGMGKGADITIEEAMVSAEGISGHLKTPHGAIRFKTPLLGRFNLYNVMAATGAAISLDIPLECVSAALECIKPVPGRMEKVGEGIDFTVLVDYAHTPDALEKVLYAIRELSPHRVITVFGCGGERDRTKRPMMGRIAARLSDIVIITSDNPRSERPEEIISEIKEGVEEMGIPNISSFPSEQHKGYLTVVDRRKAIKTALRIAQKNDIVLVAGKGHEDYQILGNQIIAFDDRKEIAEALKERFL